MKQIGEIITSVHAIVAYRAKLGEESNEQAEGVRQPDGGAPVATNSDRVCYEFCEASRR